MKSTVFILGAGSSIPFGYPSGSKLVELILDSLYPNYFYEFNFRGREGSTGNFVTLTMKQAFTDYSLFIKHGFTKEHISDFATSLRNSNKDSIDSFLLERKDFYEIGKFAIANCILKCELPNEFQFIPQSWLKYLWQKINSTRNRFVSSNISFISFNYDRVLEYFFYNSLKYGFKINEKELVNLINSLSIIHIHGIVGSFPWQDKIYGFEYDFNGQNFEQHYARVSSAAKSIKLIYDNVKESGSVFERVFDIWESATEIFAIGFGFHQLNIQRLRIDDLKNKIICSAYGLTNHECSQIEKLYEDKLILDKNNFESLDFLRNNLSIL